jgi:hypothetical protein
MKSSTARLHVSGDVAAAKKHSYDVPSAQKKW